MNPTHVENGARLPVVCSFYEGRAGVAPSENGGEFACRAERPAGTVDMNAKIDGRPATITKIRPSSSDARFTVVRFVWTEENDQ